MYKFNSNTYQYRGEKMNKKEISEYNKKLLDELSSKIQKYEKDEISAYICQDILIRTLMEFSKLEDIGGEYQ